MRRRIPILIAGSVAALFAVVTTVEAQETARDRARQTLPQPVFEELTSLADELAVDGIPDEPLFNKALEGIAKRVPPDRLLPAVRAYGGRLGDARRALGPTAGIPLLVAGADALQRGVSQEALRALPSDRPRSPVALLVLAELVESGVPPDRAIAILRQAMEQQTQDARMLDIPARVRRLIRSGVPPQEAIDRVRRTMQRDRGGALVPALPTGDRPISDRRLRDRIRPVG